MSNKRFQISLDADTVLISQAPDNTKSRVILANLDQNSLKQLARSIVNSGLDREFSELMAQEALTEV